MLESVLSKEIGPEVEVFRRNDMNNHLASMMLHRMQMHARILDLDGFSSVCIRDSYSYENDEVIECASISS